MTSRPTTPVLPPPGLALHRRGLSLRARTAPPPLLHPVLLARPRSIRRLASGLPFLQGNGTLDGCLRKMGRHFGLHGHPRRMPRLVARHPPGRRMALASPRLPDRHPRPGASHGLMPPGHLSSLASSSPRRHRLVVRLIHSATYFEKMESLNRVHALMPPSERGDVAARRQGGVRERLDLPFVAQEDGKVQTTQMRSMRCPIFSQSPNLRIAN